MATESSRYVKPQSVAEALTLIEKLFNQYRNAPLTGELLAYHQNLVQRLQTDIKAAAEREGDQKQLADLASLTDLMKRWTGLSLAGKPFPGKVRHFKLANQGPHFQRRVHKISGGHNHRASRH